MGAGLHGSGKRDRGTSVRRENTVSCVAEVAEATLTIAGYVDLSAYSSSLQ